MMHLIFENLTFNEEFKNYFKKENFVPTNQKEYQSLAIIGCQSSGKSTLLNQIFDTDFEVMSDEKGRGQTTQGIWIAINREYNTIIFDVEGTDAKERGDDRFKFEQCSSLFALVMADVLMINMWTSDIGRYTASNYGVLKIVFEMNLKLFQQESEKKIVIVLRDFNEEQDNKEDLEKCIIGDIRQIWDEIKKPEKYKNDSADKYFKFKFVTLAHKFYFEEEFNKGVMEIQKQMKPLEGEKHEYLFDHVKYDKNVPIDGMYKYTRDMWSNIINNKDLNIPGQKEMIAQFRCNEIKENAISSVTEDIAALEIESSTKSIIDFKEKVEEIVKKPINLYDEKAKDYLPHVYQDVRNLLLTTLSSLLFSSFANQQKRLIPVYQRNFRIELENRLKQNQNFYQCVDEVKQKFLKEIDEELKKIKVFDEWEVGQDNEKLFDEIIENLKQISLDEKREEIEKQISNLIEEALEARMEIIDTDFWVEMNMDIATNFYNILKAFKISLIDYYRITNEEIKTLIIDCENNIYDSFKKHLSQETRNISINAVDSFKKNFWYEEGIPRQWNQLNESFINELFEKFKNLNLTIFDLFKKFNVIKNPMKIINYEIPIQSEEENEKYLQTFSEKIKKKLRDQEEKFDDLLKDEEVKWLKVRYVEKIEEFLEDARRRHLNIKKKSIPLWAWVLLIVLAYNNIWQMLTGYWLIPMIVILGLYGILHMMGLGGMPAMVFNLVKNQLLFKSGKS